MGEGVKRKGQEGEPSITLKCPQNTAHRRSVRNDGRDLDGV